MSTPLLQQISPADNLSGVAVTTNLVLTFDQQIRLGTSGTIRIYKSDGTLFHTISITDATQVKLEISSRPQKVIINPNIDLLPGTGYYVLIDAGAIENRDGADYAGISSPTAFNFTTAGSPPGEGDTTAPTLTNTSPLDNATGVAVGSNLVLTFSESVQAGSGNIEIRKVSDNSVVKTIAVTDGTQVGFAGSQLTINPTTDLAAGTEYYVSMASGVVRDLANNNFAGLSSSTAFNFTTASAADTTAPLLTSTTPLDNATGVAVGANLVLTFNESVQAGSGNILIRKVSDSSIVKTIAVTDLTQVAFSGSQMTINPTTDLAVGTGYYVTMASGVVRDLANNNFAGISASTAFNFTTASPPADPAPTLQSTTPADNATGVAIGANLVLTFSESVQAGSGDIEIHKVSDNSVVKTIAVTDGTQVLFSGTQLYINPTTDLALATGYYVTMASGVVRDLANNDFAGISSSTVFNFTTVSSASAPVLNFTSPWDNTIDVDAGANLTLGFNEQVQAGSGNIEIRNANGTIAKTIAITDTSQVSFFFNQVTINPSSDLADGASYYVTLGSGVILDLDGNAFDGISSPTAFNFTTAPPDIIGTPGNDTLNGTSGNETLDGRTGLDTLSGGLGNDTYIIQNYEGGGTSIYLESEAGEPIGDGKTYAFLPSADELNWGLIDYTGDGVVDYVSVRYHGDDNWFHFDFSTTELGTNFVPGTYTDAQYAQFASPGHPGLSVTGNGRGHGTIAGNFVVRAAVFDFGGDVAEIVSLSIVFEQYAGSTDGPKLFGILNYNYAAGGPVTWDAVVENANQGTDTVEAWVNYTLPANVENLTLKGSEDTNGTGNSLNNVIMGNGGDNIIDGKAGADSMNGGVGGNDTFIVDNVGDTVSDGYGIDTVLSSVTFTSSGFIEYITLTGTGNINGTGNNGDETITGNAGTNVLTGLFGNDIYIVNSALDTVVEVLDQGNDIIKSPVTYTLPDNVEQLILTGSGNVDGTGNALDNIITGTYQSVPGTGRNDLYGGAGNDTLNGLTGFDTLSGGQGDDTYILDNYEGGQSSVIVYAESNYSPAPASVFSFNNPDNFHVSQFGLDANEQVDLIDFSYYDPIGGDYASIEISTEQLGIPLTAGTYLNTYPYSEQPGRAGLQVAVTGNSSGYSYGAFTITNIVFDYSGDVPVLVSLSVSFEIESSLGAAILGTFNYNYAPAGPAALDEVIEDAGEGTDTVRSAKSYVLGANLENLTLTGDDDLTGTGNAANNVITGNWGDNIIDGKAGADTMAGSSGDDTYVVDNATDLIVEDAFNGTDTVESSITRTLEDNVEKLVLTGNAAINGTGNSLANTFTGNTAANVFSGGTGDDVYYLGAGDTVVENSAAGTDIVLSSLTQTLTANVENLTLLGNGNVNGTGNGLDNILIGTNQQVPGFGTNVLTGGGGNDTLNGGTGFDTLIGGLGDDTYIMRNFEGGQTSFLFERRPSDLEAGFVWSDVPAPNEVIVSLYDFTGDGLIDTLDLSRTGYSFRAGFSTTQLGANLAPGTYQDATFWSTPGHAQVGVTAPGLPSYGQNGKFTIVELVIDYSGPAPVLVSFSATLELDPYYSPSEGQLYGTVTYNYAPGGTAQFDSIVENAGEGTDTVQSSLRNYTLPANIENLILTGYQESLNGTGNTLNNVITGNDGANILDGGLGADTLIGGWGEDTYVIDNVGDSIVEMSDSASQRDTVLSALSYTLGAYVENLTLTGSANINGTGNALNNILTGNSGINILAGATGDDTYVISSLADSIVENAGEGSDEVLASITYALPGQVENLTLTGSNNINGTGNALANTLIGNEGANVLAGAAGDDRYVVDSLDDTLVESLNEGFDQVLSYVSYTLPDNIEKLTLAQDYGYLNGTGNGIANVLIGNSQNNIIDGAAGADTMIGNFGSDTYFVDDLGDVVDESSLYGNGGIDKVFSSVSFALGVYVEDLTLTGNANISGTGNELANILTGNTGNNALNGGAGNDTFKILAGGGSDTIGDFSAGAGVGDVVVLDGFVLGTFSAVQSAMTQNGANTVLNLGNGESLTFLNVAKASFAANDFSFLNVQGPPPPPPGPEPFTLPVSGAYTNTITGTRRVDNLTGTAANNRLDGRQGNDTMTGLAGDDTYVVNALGDTVVESSNNGIDTVISSAASYTLANHVENLTLTGTITHAATGNGLDNLIIASSGPDIINGGAGNDILRAGTGACVLTGGAGNDIFDFDLTGSQKQITDFTVGQDLVDLRTLLAWYGGSNPLADNAIALSAVAGGVLVSVKASAGGTLQGLVKLTGVNLVDLHIGSDILWDA